MSERRNFDDPQYKRWRTKVYARDRFRCRMPDCAGTDRRLNAHHIKKWASFPHLRFVLSNGVTLCRTCHERVRGHEEEHEVLFSSIVNPPTTDLAVKMLMFRYAAKPQEAAD
jgi:hypothetical protein